MRGAIVREPLAATIVVYGRSPISQEAVVSGWAMVLAAVGRAASPSRRKTAFPIDAIGRSDCGSFRESQSLSQQALF